LVFDWIADRGVARRTPAADLGTDEFKLTLREAGLIRLVIWGRERHC
jgi:hypothetical protein